MIPDDPIIDASQLKGLWIPAEIFHNQSLCPNEKILLALIWHLDQHQFHCYASNKWLAKQIGISQKRIANIITKLKKQGLIEQLQWNGKFRILRYCGIKPM